MALAALAVMAGLTLAPARGFNLDTRAPAVKLGPSNLDGETYFGFSVAQHLGARESGPVMLVGAPRDKNLQPGTYR